MADAADAAAIADSEPDMLNSGYLGYECFQNYTAAEVFVQGLAGTVSRDDTEDIIRAQKLMLQRFEKTNAMLTNCSALSAQRLVNTQADFRRHVQLLTELRRDLTHVFERVRKLKTKLAGQYPKQFSEATNRRALPEEEEDCCVGASSGVAAASASVRRRERPRGPSSGQHRHSYHAGSPSTTATAPAVQREPQESEPAPHSSSDSSDDADVASLSSTNS